jgi:hypothetical protein
MFREPLIVLGIADFEAYAFTPGQSPDTGNSNDVNAEIPSAIKDLKEEYRTALVHKVLLFDHVSAEVSRDSQADVIFIPPAKELKTTTIRTMMCDITSHFLAEMTTLAISIKALPSIASPTTSIASPTISQSGSNGVASSQWWHDEKPSLSRTNSQPGEAGRSASPAINNLHRMSMPVFPTTSPSLGDLGRDSPPVSPETGRDTPPPKTFEEMAGSDRGSGSPGSRPASTNPSREHSRDRVSVHGFGPGSVNERNRNKGRARVGLVIGSLYLQTGRWHDALRELSEGAAKARSFSDHLWHAKALENITVCMILLLWSGVDFKVRLLHAQHCYNWLISSKAHMRLRFHRSVFQIWNGQSTPSPFITTSRTTLPPQIVTVVRSVLLLVKN